MNKEIGELEEPVTSVPIHLSTSHLPTNSPIQSAEIHWLRTYDMPGTGTMLCTAEITEMEKMWFLLLRGSAH